MFIQIAVGTGLLVLNFTIAAVAAMVMEAIFLTLHPWLMREPHRPKLVALIVLVSVWVLGVVTAGIWIWAVVLWGLGALPTMEAAFHFSLAAYTTLGLGDLVPAREWRLLSGMEAANGLLTFGLLTALLVDTLREVRLGQGEHRRRHKEG